MQTWKRSFPPAQIQDHSWMINVLEDLANYCEHNTLPAVEHEIRQTLERIMSLHAYSVFGDRRYNSVKQLQ